MSLRRRAPLPIALSSAFLSLALVASPATAAGPTVSVVASGLDNPRGIDVGADGRVFVAAAGHGGAAGGFGTSGRIVVIDHGAVRTYVGGLPSAMSDEGEVTGPVNVALDARGDAVAVIGGGPQAVDPRFNTVLRLRPPAGRILGDIQSYQNSDPDPTDIDPVPNPYDSNPYGIAVLDGARTLVADAGNNDLLLVGPTGRIVTVARFPNQMISTAFLPPFFGIPNDIELPAEAVPTSVAVGPDGYWYVGELKGFPFTPGTSRIWRIAPSARGVTCDPAATSGPCTLYMDGFTSITGLDFGPDGSLYVVEMVKAGVLNAFIGGDVTGALWKVKGGTKTELVPGRLTLPDDVAIARGGRIYVTNLSISVGGGEVLAITP